MKISYIKRTYITLCKLQINQLNTNRENPLIHIKEC